MVLYDAHAKTSRRGFSRQRRSVILLAAIVVTFVIYTSWTRSPLPADNFLLAHYATNRNAFGVLAGKVTHNPSGIDADLLSGLSITAAATDPRAPGVVFFRFSEERLVLDPCETDVLEKGFAYCDRERLETVESLDAFPEDLGRRYRKVDSNWYIYYSHFAETQCE